MRFCNDQIYPLMYQSAESPRQTGPPGFASSKLRPGRRANGPTGPPGFASSKLGASPKGFDPTSRPGEQALGFMMQDTGCRIQDLDFGFWIADFGMGNINKMHPES